jgi:outer membrane lipoprotein SlyB
LTEFKNYSGSKNDKDWQTIKIELLQADMEGALCGAIAGGIVGAIYGSVLMPGVGTITAAIVEAVHCGVYGAIVSSGWQAIKILVSK